MKNKTFILIFTLAAALRVLWVSVPSLWYDENFTLLISRLPLPDMIRATAGDVHPPLWYLITWSLIHLAPNAPAWIIRVPSILFSLAALITFRAVMREWILPERVQMIALIIMSLLPFQIWYAQEGRMYALLEFEVLLALLFVLRGNWIGVFITAAAMLYTQNYSLLYLASLGTVVLIRDRRAIFHAAAAIGLAGMMYLPWAFIVARQIQGISGRYWIVEQTIGDVLNILYKLFFNSAMPSFGVLSALIVTFYSLIIGIVHMARGRHAAIKSIVIMAFLPLVLAWIISLLWQPILLHRPLIGSAPFLYLVAAWSLTRLQSIRDQTITAALVVPVMLTGIIGYYSNVEAMKTDGAISTLTMALEHVEANWQEGDIIYYTDDGPMINLRPYTDLPQYQMPACGNRMNSGPVLGSLSPQTRDALGITVLPLEDIPHRRAWILAPMSPLHPRCYEKQIAEYVTNEPLIVVDDNDFIYSALWLK